MLNAINGRTRRQPGRWRHWIDRLLKGTHHHFLILLPSRPGVLTWLMQHFFTGITIDPPHLDIIRRLPPSAVLIYTIKFKSYFEFLFYHFRFQREKVPAPELIFGRNIWLLQPVSRILRNLLAHFDYLVTRRRALDPYSSGFLEQQLLNGRVAMLPLVEKHGFRRRFVKAKTDPLRFLIELQQRSDRPIYIVPQLMFFSKSPTPAIPRLRDILLGSEQRPGLVRRLLTMFRNPGKVFVEVSQPLAVSEFLAQPEIQRQTPEYQALQLRRQLLRQHNRHRQSITGPVLKSHEEIKEGILANERLRQFMTQHAESRKEPLHAVRREADNYLDEIAAKYSYSFVNLVSGPVSWLLNTMFDGTVVDKEGLQRLKTMSQRGPLILIPCHKSHVDYLILSYILFKHNMPAPHVAAGKNLSFWPMGPFFRAGGAFFLRRTFRGAVLYSKVFSEYIHKLLEEGFNIELFIEGGRSRSGKLLIPKLGLLTILLNAFKNGACDDMIFVPVFIGYDQVLEESAYLQEIEGGKKEPESLGQVLRARRFLKRRYGKIYINFNEPISLKDLLQDNGGTLHDMPQKKQNELCRNLGWRVINAIDKVSVVNPHSLVAAAILNCPLKSFTSQEIFENVDTYSQYLTFQNAKFADTLLLDHQRACGQALQNYLQRKIIDLPGNEKNMPAEMAQYNLPAGKRLRLEYYKNNCIAHFVPAALTALAILEKDAFQFSAADLHDRYRYCQDFFKYEFAFDVDKPAEYFVRKSLKAFIDDAILMPHATLPDTYQITSLGLRKLKLFARFMKPYLESYWIVLQYLKQTEREDSGAKDRLRKIHSLGRTMLKRQEIELSEALSTINFENGLTYFMTHRVKGSEDRELIESYELTIRQFLGCL
jgi:glycerol-3-phosphate O-acyltransferase